METLRVAANGRAFAPAFGGTSCADIP